MLEKSIAGKVGTSPAVVSDYVQSALNLMERRKEYL